MLWSKVSYFMREVPISWNQKLVQVDSPLEQSAFISEIQRNQHQASSQTTGRIIQTTTTKCHNKGRQACLLGQRKLIQNKELSFLKECRLGCVYISMVSCSTVVQMPEKFWVMRLHSYRTQNPKPRNWKIEKLSTSIRHLVLVLDIFKTFLFSPMHWNNVKCGTHSK